MNEKLLKNNAPLSNCGTSLQDNLKKLINNSNSINGMKHLARNMGIPYTTLHQLVTNDNINPKASTLIPIARYFNVSVEELMGAKPMLDANARIVPWDSSLYQKCCDNIIVTLNDTSDYFENAEIITATIWELYCYSVNGGGKIDHSLAKWLVDVRVKKKVS